MIYPHFQHYRPLATIASPAIADAQDLSLPPEIWILIMEYLPLSQARMMFRVHRFFWSLARPYIWQNLQLHIPHTPDAENQPHYLSEHPELATSVRSLSLTTRSVQQPHGIHTRPQNRQWKTCLGLSLFNSCSFSRTRSDKARSAAACYRDLDKLSGALIPLLTNLDDLSIYAAPAASDAYTTTLSTEEIEGQIKRVCASLARQPRKVEISASLSQVDWVVSVLNDIHTHTPSPTQPHAQSPYHLENITLHLDGDESSPTAPLCAPGIEVVRFEALSRCLSSIPTLQRVEITCNRLDPFTPLGSLSRPIPKLAVLELWVSSAEYAPKTNVWNAIQLHARTLRSLRLCMVGDASLHGCWFVPYSKDNEGEDKVLFESEEEEGEEEEEEEEEEMPVAFPALDSLAIIVESPVPKFSSAKTTKQMPQQFAPFSWSLRTLVLVGPPYSLARTCFLLNSLRPPPSGGALPALRSLRIPVVELSANLFSAIATLAPSVEVLGLAYPDVLTLPPWGWPGSKANKAQKRKEFYDRMSGNEQIAKLSLKVLDLMVIVQGSDRLVGLEHDIETARRIQDLVPSIKSVGPVDWQEMGGGFNAVG